MKQSITNRNDIISILSSWWPEQKGFPCNVHVDFSMLDKKYNLHPGSTAAVIEDVAKLNGFLKESGGDSHATFTYDIPPIITI